MKALVYTNTNEVMYREEPLRELGAGEAQIRIEAVGICGSDMHAYHGEDARRVPPLILGHEAAGVIVSGKQAGQQVVLNPLIACGTCEDCRGGRSNLCTNRKLIGMDYPGAFAEFITIPEQNMIPMPAGMKPTHAALTNPPAPGARCAAWRLGRNAGRAPCRVVMKAACRMTSKVTRPPQARVRPSTNIIAPSAPP